MSEKVLTLPDLTHLRDRLDAEGKKLVLTNGCFDLLHVGHVRYLAQARALGDALIVAINDDDSVRQLKGPSRPINSQDDRAEILAALACVDFVTVFSGPRLTGLIHAVRPHRYAKGGDYTLSTLDPGEREALEACGTEISILSLVPGRSTTALIRQMGPG